MTIRTHHVVGVLDKRIAWLGAKMETFENKTKDAYHMMALEKAAMAYARKLVQREVEFKQRLELEDRFTARDEAYYDEFMQQVTK